MPDGNDYSVFPLFYNRKQNNISEKSLILLNNNSDIHKTLKFHQTLKSGQTYFPIKPDTILYKMVVSEQRGRGLVVTWQVKIRI